MNPYSPCQWFFAGCVGRNLIIWLRCPYTWWVAKSFTARDGSKGRRRTVRPKHTLVLLKNDFRSSSVINSCGPASLANKVTIIGLFLFLTTSNLPPGTPASFNHLLNHPINQNPSCQQYRANTHQDTIDPHDRNLPCSWAKQIHLLAMWCQRSLVNRHHVLNLDKGIYMLLILPLKPWNRKCIKA